MRNIFKIVLLTGCLAQATPFRGHAQTGSDPASPVQFQPDMLAHSPEAEQMTKYVTMPVTLYSGMPNVSVPIYDLKTKSLDVPISLGYNYNGFKPAEVAGYAGLGWSVQGGGVITRMVKSRVDHYDPHVLGNDYDDYVNINLLTLKQEMLQNTALDLIDGEPDIYVFSCNGMSGKFILLQGQAYMLPYQHIRVTGSGTAGFILTDEKGNQYTFDKGERTHHKILEGTDYVPDHYSAWYLSRIVSADKADTVSYDYTGYTFQQPPVYSEVYSYEVAAGSTITLNSAHNLRETGSNGDYVQSLLLSSISYKDISIYFNLDPAPRQDIFFNDGSLSRLSSVSIFDTRRSGFSKNITLKHDYYNGKLTLMEVQSAASQDPVDSSTLQRWQFQYLGSKNASTIPGFETRSIDHFGYYNGAQNQMLFTQDDIPVSPYTFADREPHPAYSQLGMMSQMSYPTGGYSTFAYEQNQTGHYIVTGQYYHDEDTTAATATWPGNDPSFIGPASGGGTFVINEDQTPKLVADYGPSDGNPNTTEGTVKIFTLSGTPVLTMTLTGDDTESTTYPELTAGAYNYIVTASKKGVSASVSIVFYNKKPLIDNTLGPAPGLRVKTISHYDNAAATIASLVKQYTYQEGVGLWRSGTHSSTLIRHSGTCPPPAPSQPDSAVTTLQAGLYSPISDVLNNQFYYQYVEEADIGPENIGKKVYTYNCFAPDEPDVFQTSEAEYGFDHGVYYPLHRTASQYQLHDKYYFQTFTTTLTDQQYPGYYCLPVPTTDVTQPVAGVYNLYAAVHNMLVGGFKTLQSTVDSTWDMNGQNPVVAGTNYFYDNPSYVYPTRVQKWNSKGQLETTYIKYALDYPAPGNGTLAGYDSSWAALQDGAINTYNTCYDALLGALNPYQPYSLYQSQFTQVANSYHCEADLKQNSAAAFAARNANWAAYLAGLNDARYSDPTTWKRAIYHLESTNAVSTPIEQLKTIQLGDGNEYLLGATRNDFSLMTDAAGNTVAKQTQIETTELSTPLLYSSFAANPGNYYKPQVSMSYDPQMALVSQNRINKVDNVKYFYLWGYNHRFPVAEVEGSDSATVAGLVDQAVLDNPAGDNVLRTELNKIRTGLAGTRALVTTSTYDPLIGMTSKTDPAGRTTYFEYDGIGRLIDIKDLNGNIIKTFRYHFAQ